MNKAAFMTQLHAARAEWDTAWAAIDPARMEEPGRFGDWTLKDLLAHVSWYEREITNTLTTHVLAGSEWWQHSDDPRNALIYASYAATPLATVRAEARVSYVALLAALKPLVDADFTDASRYAGMPAEWVPAEMFAGNCYEHYRAHLPTLRAARNRTS
jgi:hypothetical protein